jgi:PEP-CTERM motif
MDILTSVSANANQSFGLIDNVKVVPEPSSLVMAGLGLAGLALRLRRR